MERGEGGRRVLSHPHRPPLRIGGEKVFSQTFFRFFFCTLSRDDPDRNPGPTTPPPSLVKAQEILACIIAVYMWIGGMSLLRLTEREKRLHCFSLDCPLLFHPLSILRAGLLFCPSVEKERRWYIVTPNV